MSQHPQQTAPGRRRKRRTQRPPEQQSRPKPRKPMKMDELFDVHVRSGLDDDRVRMHRKDYTKLWMYWAIAGEDVVLRNKGNNYEIQIVLRGGQNGRIRVNAANKAKRLPLVRVLTIEEVRQQLQNNADKQEPTE